MIAPSATSENSDREGLVNSHFVAPSVLGESCNQSYNEAASGSEMLCDIETEKAFVDGLEKSIDIFDKSTNYATCSMSCIKNMVKFQLVMFFISLEIFMT